jgi:SAM-dependent methyltransferase
MVEVARSHAEELAKIERGDFWSKVKTTLILELVEGGDVLDVGCGAGLLSEKLLKKGCSLIAIDSDSKAVEITRKKGVTVFTADITRWQTDKKFDGIVATDVLEHIGDDKAVIKKIYAMLKPNGCFVVNVPSYRFLFGTHDVSLGHKRRYSDAELKAKLEGAGFKIEYQRHWNLLALPITIVTTKILKRDYPHERVSKLDSLSRLLEKLLLLDSKINYRFGISILCKARK